MLNYQRAFIQVVWPNHVKKNTGNGWFEHPKLLVLGWLGGLYLLWLFGLFSLASHSFNELPLVSFSHSLFLWLIIGKLSCGIIDATGLCLSKIEAAVIVSYNF
jgi:hypothetical protein